MAAVHLICISFESNKTRRGRSRPPATPPPATPPPFNSTISNSAPKDVSMRKTSNRSEDSPPSSAILSGSVPGGGRCQRNTISIVTKTTMNDSFINYKSMTFKVITSPRCRISDFMMFVKTSFKNPTRSVQFTKLSSA